MKWDDTCKMLSSFCPFHIGNAQYWKLLFQVSWLLPKNAYVTLSKLLRSKEVELLLGGSKRLFSFMSEKECCSGKTWVETQDGILKVGYQDIFIPANKNLPSVSGFPLSWWDSFVFVLCTESLGSFSPCNEYASEFLRLTEIDRNFMYLNTA